MVEPSADAARRYEQAVRRFRSAPSVAECGFVRGTTEAINQVANTGGSKID